VPVATTVSYFSASYLFATRWRNLAGSNATWNR
jgi:hypothetical protein